MEVKEMSKPSGLVVPLACLLAVAASAEAPLLRTTAFSWEDVLAKPAPNGRTRRLLQSPTATLDELEIHVTTLPPGQASHAPHKHPEEEVIIVKEGTVEAFLAGETRRLGPGAVMFMASEELHAVKNVGETPATYHVMQWFCPGWKKKSATQ